MSRLRADGGFSLVELLITLLLLGIVFGAAMTALDAFQRQAHADNGRGDAQDAARQTVDALSSSLRGVVGTGTAAGIDRASGRDIVVRVVDGATPPVSGGANTARLMYLRYCVDTTTQVLYEETFHWTTAAVPSTPDAGAAPSYPCPGSGWDSVRQVVKKVTTTGGNIFSFAPDSANVAQIGIDLALDLGRPGATTTLRSGVTLRNLNHPPTVVLNCAGVGSGQVVCDSFGTADPDNQALAYAWSYGSGSGCTGLTALPTTQPQLNQAGLSAGTYCFKLTVSDPSGAAASATQVVTAR